MDMLAHQFLFYEMKNLIITQVGEIGELMPSLYTLLLNLGSNWRMATRSGIVNK